MFQSVKLQMGGFRVGSSDYLIEPIADQGDEEDAVKPHRIYRRSLKGKREAKEEVKEKNASKTFCDSEGLLLFLTKKCHVPLYVYLRLFR